jgi:hypothetical protein
MKNIDDYFKPISKETIFKKPKPVSDQGFASKKTVMKETKDGIERHVEESILLSACGEVIKESEISGRCDICGGYTCPKHIYHCAACQKTLCLRDVRFFRDNESEYVYCPEHFTIAVYNHDTWKRRK